MQTGRWSLAERWSRRRIKAGKIADLSDFEQRAKERKRGWSVPDAPLVIRSDFLTEILLDQQGMAQIPWQGVRMANAHIRSALDLSGQHLARPVSLASCTFDDSVNLGGVHSDHSLLLSYCHVMGSIRMEGASLGGEVSLEGCRTRFLPMARLRAEQGLNLSAVEVREEDSSGKPIKREYCADEAYLAIDLSGADIRGDLILSGIRVAGHANLNGVRTGKSLALQPTPTRRSRLLSMDLAGARIGENLFMNGAVVACSLNMAGLEAKNSLFLNAEDGGYRSAFGEISLSGARIGHNLFMSGARVHRLLDMEGIRVEGSIFLRSAMRRPKEARDAPDDLGGHVTACSQFGRIRLNGAHVGGDLLGDAALFTGLVYMHRVNVRGNLDMRGATFGARCVLALADIGASLRLAGASVPCLILAGAQVTRDLDLGIYEHEGKKDDDPIVRVPCRCSCADLSNARVGGLIDWIDEGKTDQPWWIRLLHRLAWDAAGRPHSQCLVGWLTSDDAGRSWSDPWPGRPPTGSQEKTLLELDGFTYSRFPGHAKGSNGTERGRRSDKWYLDWLLRDRTFTPQPYEQLASVLRSAGAPVSSNTVLYGGRDRRRWDGGLGWLRRAGLFLLKITIGYGIGYRLFLSLLWVALLVCMGAAMLKGFEVKKLPLESSAPSMVSSGTSPGATQAPRPEASPDLKAETSPQESSGRPPLEAQSSALTDASGIAVNAPEVTINGRSRNQEKLEPLSWTDRFVYSFDQLIPAYKLEPKLSERVQLLDVYTRLYFNVHRIIGVVLTVFVAAALGGLTQKT